uniref:Uncharacterized protein n=1 Tax=Oryza sativa subsp. japonica TaxID=39947 RepID=Q5ZA93_ORYSJ|nr:hypothetical protein [Oryza sativa Japonica Group]
MEDARDRREVARRSPLWRPPTPASAGCFLAHDDNPVAIAFRRARLRKDPYRRPERGGETRPGAAAAGTPSPSNSGLFADAALHDRLRWLDWFSCVHSCKLQLMVYVDKYRACRDERASAGLSLYLQGYHRFARGRAVAPPRGRPGRRTRPSRPAGAPLLCLKARSPLLRLESEPLLRGGGRRSGHDANESFFRRWCRRPASSRELARHGACSAHCRRRPCFAAGRLSHICRRPRREEKRKKKKRAGDSIPQATLHGSDETNLFKTSPTEKNFNSGVEEKSKTEYYPLYSASHTRRGGNGQPPVRAAVNPEADQPDTPADPTPSRPPSPGYVG